MRGRMDFVNSFMSLTTKLSPWGPQETTCAHEVSSSILRSGEVSGGRSRGHGMEHALVELLDKVGGGGHVRLALVLYRVLVGGGGG